MAFTALFVSEMKVMRRMLLVFFGVHRIVSNESYIAVVGGTGKYENARGYAKIETVYPDQHPSNGWIDNSSDYCLPNLDV
ncbi:Dirigent protein [Sesbania bispinosa]|nr:Dirigent protein [Sesbania bispinosa]